MRIFYNLLSVCLLPVAALTVFAANPKGPDADIKPPGARRPQRTEAFRRDDPRVRQIPINIDMGPDWRVANDAINCRDLTRDEGFAWSEGLVRYRERSNASDRWLAGFAESNDATFLIAMEPADTLYSITLTFGDPAEARGPVAVAINDIPMTDGLATAAGESRDLTVEVEPENGRIAIRMSTTDCRGFALAGVVIEGPARGKLGMLFPDSAAVKFVPDPGTLPVVTEADLKTTLREFCDFLIASQPRQGGFSYQAAWYQNAYAVRTLLAGSRLLSEPVWSEPALVCLDAFVDQQGPDANWLSRYRDPSNCHPDDAADSLHANLADVGSMTTCLGLVIPLVDGARQEAYRKAAEDYAKRISLPRQFPDGSFPNGRYDGVENNHPYSVATACQTASLAALYLATGDLHYRAAAERGARWLADNSITPDGQFMLHLHDRPNAILRDATDFGNLFYVADAFILARMITEDDALKAAMDATMDRWLFGPEGAKATAKFGYWWPPKDVWGDSKMGSMIYVLANHPDNANPDVRRWLDLALRWISSPPLRRSIGVTLDPASPRGEYALAATGYAGIGVAAALSNRAGSLFQTSADKGN